MVPYCVILYVSRSTQFRTGMMCPPCNCEWYRVGKILKVSQHNKRCVVHGTLRGNRMVARETEAQRRNVPDLDE